MRPELFIGKHNFFWGGYDAMLEVIVAMNILFHGDCVQNVSIQLHTVGSQPFFFLSCEAVSIALVAHRRVVAIFFFLVLLGYLRATCCQVTCRQCVVQCLHDWVVLYPAFISF